MTTDIHADAYEARLFSGLPLVSTRLVHEAPFAFTERAQLTSPADAYALLRSYISTRDREEFIILLMDTANTVIGLSIVSVGGLAASIVEPRQVFKTAFLANAAGILCAHNHPSGNPEPSQQDLRLTRQLVEAGRLLGVPVHDHLIVTTDTYTSFAERGLL